MSVAGIAILYIGTHEKPGRANRINLTLVRGTPVANTSLSSVKVTFVERSVA